jgi:hypothetical protein
VQAWAFRRYNRLAEAGEKPEHGTFGQAALALCVTPEEIRDAVDFGYWLFTHDDDLPIAERRIDLDGE